MICHTGGLAGGALGVDLFFVLSGFLITTLLLEEWNREQTIHFRRFYWRRALRLLPALYLVTAILVLVTRVVPGFSRFLPWPSVVATLLYSYNWFEIATHARSILGHCWSLAIEEQFYFVWPAVLLPCSC